MTRVILALTLCFLAYQRSQPLPQIAPTPLPISSLSQSDLELIPGVGPVMAQKLISSTSGDLTDIHGVGEKLAQKWSPYLRLDQP